MAAELLSADLAVAISRLAFRKGNKNAAALFLSAFLSRQNIAEPEAIALNFFTGYDWDSLVKHGPGIRKGMELAIFAARIDPSGKLLKQCLVKVAANKVGRQLFGINAD